MRYLLKILLLGMCLSCKPRTSDQQLADTDDYRQKHYSSIEPTLFAEELIAKARSFKSLEGFLGSLSKAAFADHVLVYDTLSLQRASFERPRVIVPFDNAIVAFNELPTVNHPTNERTLEILTFDKAGKMEAVEIIYDGDQKKNPTVDRPAMCQDCHRYKARPNFAKYFLWPGFYGSDDDYYNNPQNNTNYVQSLKEEKGYQDFVKVQNDQVRQEKGIYRFLVGTRPKPDGYYLNRPNLRFLHRINDMNWRRILSDLQSMRSVLDQNAGALRVALCLKSIDFQTKLSDVARANLWRSIKEFFTLALKMHLGGERAKMHRHERVIGLKQAEIKSRAREISLDSNIQTTDLKDVQLAEEIPKNFDYYRDVLLLLILERFVGIDISHWSVEFPNANYFFDLDTSGAVMGPSKKSLFSVLLPNEKPKEPGNCVSTESDIKNAERMFASNELFPTDDSFDTFEECSSCHYSNARSAQYIPFGNQKELGRFLTQNLGLAGEMIRRIKSDVSLEPFHMPPAAQLPSQQQQRMLTYLQQFLPR